MDEAKRATSASARSAYLVLGTYHSGAEALATLVEANGARGAADQVVPGLGELNDDILGSIGLAWSTPAQIADDLAKETYDTFGERGREVLNAEFGPARDIVLCDPRVCRLLPFWQRVLTELGFDLGVAIISRPPEEVAAQLESQNQLEPSQALKLWMRYNLEAEETSRGMHRRFFRFDEVTNGGESALSKLAELGLGNAIEAAGRDPIDAGTIEARPPGETPLPPEFGQIDCTLAAWSAQGESSTDYEILDAIHAAGPNDDMNQLSKDPDEDIYAKLRTQAAELAQLTEILVSSQKERDELTRKATSQQAELDSLKREIDALSAVAAREVATSQENKELHALVARTENRRAKAARENEELHALVATVEGRRLKAAEENAELHALVASVEEKRAQTAELLSAAQEAEQIMRNSTSWRLTAPIRFFKRLLQPR